MGLGLVKKQGGIGARIRIERSQWKNYDGREAMFGSGW